MFREKNLFVFAVMIVLCAVFFSMALNEAWAMNCKSGEVVIKIIKNSGGIADLSNGTSTSSDATIYRVCSAKGGRDLTVTPDPGHEIKSVKIRNKHQTISTPTIASSFAISLKKATVVKVVFRPITYTINISSSDSDITISPDPKSGHMKRKYGTSVKFVLRSKNSAKTPSLTLDDSAVTLTKSGNKYKYTLTVLHDHTVVAGGALSASAPGLKDASKAFPMSFAVSSPLTANEKIISKSAAFDMSAPDNSTSDVEDVIDSIDKILAGKQIADCQIGMQYFMTANTDVDSARINGVLRMLAGMICVANVNGIPLPSGEESIDLALQMNSAGTTGVIYNSAVISHSDASGSEEFSYSVNISINSTANGTPGFDNLIVTLTHRPGNALGTYAGSLNYRMNSSDPQVDCKNELNGNGDITSAGSVLYQKNSQAEILADVKSAAYCGHDINPFQTDGMSNDGM